MSALIQYAFGFCLTVFSMILAGFFGFYEGSRLGVSVAVIAGCITVLGLFWVDVSWWAKIQRGQEFEVHP